MRAKHLTFVWITFLALSAMGLAVVAMAGPTAHAGVRTASPFAITAHQPLTHEVGVPLTSTIQATFDDDVNAGTVTSATFVVHGHLGGLATGTFAYDGGTRTVTLDPDRAFHAGEVLRVSATGGISSSGGAPLMPYGWQFTAGEVYSRVGGFADIGAGLTGVYYSSVAWGDYDNDGDLDILLTGLSSGGLVSKVYRNDGGGAFTDTLAALTGVRESSVAWGDYDNDGDLDILLTGDSGSGYVSKVYRNDGGGGFTDIGAGLTGVYHSSVAWGDVDNDGDLDILLTGYTGTFPVSKVYRNDGPSGFIDIGAGLTAVDHSSVAWGDYDNDGDLDILLTGMNYPFLLPVSTVYRNDGGGAFTDISAGLIAVDESSVAWGDVDNDGDLDILLTGWDGSNRVSKVYRNDGPSGFTDIGAGLTGVKDSSVAWGDYDNDGDLDILLTGDDGHNKVSKVYRNDGAGAFSDIGAGLTGVDESSVAWGDVDNDGDLDILLTGLDASNLVSKVYRNDDCPRIIAHQPQTHEVGVALSANISATFDEDVNAGTVTNDTFVVHGHLGGLTSGTFAYDGGTRTVSLDPDRTFHAGEVLRVSATSAISSTGGARLARYGWQFTAGDVHPRDVAGFADIGAGLTGVYDSSAAWGDVDNDGDLDILLTGHPTVAMLCRNDGGGSFSDIGAGLTGVDVGSVAWGDYDNDGDLDILLTGRAWTGSAQEPVSKVYRNDGASGFSDIGAGLIGVQDSSVAWGDYDNDGDLDILLTGNSGYPTFHVSRVYRSDGASGFTDIGAGLTGVSVSSVAWGDYDNDGDLDILLTGVDDAHNRVSKVYRNDGGGGFTDIGAALQGVTYGSVAWGDYDNDGDLDILLTGYSSGGPVSKVYRNDGGGGFTDIGAGLTGVYYSSVAWGDYDNDGDLDILLTGWDGSNRVSTVYRNDGSGAFSDIGASLTAVRSSSVAWGDVDNDGDLDILLTGSSDGGAVSKVYCNNSAPWLGSVTPASGSGPVGATTYFTTTWSDPDGWEDLKHGYFHIGASPSIIGNVTLLYNAVKDKLWLRSDDGTAWTGGYAPESANTLENSQAIVHCDLTTTAGSGDTLSVKWAIEFKPGFEGTKKLGLKCKDRSKARAKARWKGTWTITTP